MNIEQQGNAFYAMQDGEAIGHIEFQSQDANVIVCTHTFVEPQMRGYKVAQYLLDALSDYARDNALTILPQCSYVATAFARFPEKYQDVATTR